MEAKQRNSDRKKGNYYFVSLQNSIEDFLSDSCPGHFNLLQEVQGNCFFPRLMVLRPKELIGKIDDTLDTLSPREAKILRERYLSGTSTIKSLRSSGLELNLTGERLRQIENKAIRKMRHPSRTKYIRSLMFDDLFKLCQDTREQDYASCFERIIKNDISVFKRTGEKKNIVFKEIINSPRFDVNNEDDHYYALYLDVFKVLEEEIDIKPRPIKKHRQEKEKEDIKPISIEPLNNNDKEKESISIPVRIYPKYKLDEHTIFNVPSELPLTRCGLQGAVLFDLLIHGFFYVSDLTKYYDEISFYPGENHLSFKKERTAESDSIRNLLEFDEKALLKQEYYEEPLFRIKIPTNLEREMHEKGIISESDLRYRRDYFTKSVRQELDALIEKIDKARVEINGIQAK